MRLLRTLVVLLPIWLLAGCRLGAATPTWTPDERGLPGYAIATGLAVGPDETVYVSTYREGAIYVRRPGERWTFDPSLGNLAGFGVAAATRSGLALAATVDGLYRTEDAGRHWARVSERDPVYSVLFDSKGTAWAGREGGLLRSDDGGRTWQEAARLEPATTVLGLAEGPAGIILATAGGGMRLFRADGLHQTLQVREVASSVASDSHGRLAARIEGRIWWSETGETWNLASLLERPVIAVGSAGDALLAATEGAGVLQSRDGGRTWTPVGGAIGDSVYAVGGRDRVWAATAHGVLVAGAAGWETTGDGFGRPLVRGLAADGGLLAATSDGVYRREADGWRPSSRDLRGVLTLFVLPAAGSLFAGAWERGVVRSDDNGRTWQTATEFEYRRAIVPALASAGETIVARVEYDRTLRSRDRGESWALADAGLAGRTVFALTSDGRSVWAGTDQGVSLLGDDAWQALLPLGRSVTSLLSTPDGLVVGTSDGLWRLDEAGWQRAGLAARHVVTILAGSDGRPSIVGASDGVFRRSGDRWEALGPAGVRVNAVVIDADGSIVVAAESGVWRLR